jgi:hypothetical protein
MSKIESLKKQFPHLNITLLDILSQIDGTKTHKYTQLLCTLLSNSHTATSRMTSNELDKEIEYQLDRWDIPQEENPNINYIKFRLLESFYRDTDIQLFSQFKEYIERGLIDNKDITKFSTFDDVSSSVTLAEIRSVEKELTNQVIKEFEDDKWLLVRPLSFQSSVKYGAATKWCTTFQKEKNYFFKYFHRGALVYCINKITGYKVAMSGEMGYDTLVEVFFWNAEDRRMDFFSVDLDDYLIPTIKRIIKENRTNSSFLDNETLHKVAHDCNCLYHLEDDNLKVAEAVGPIALIETPQTMRA